jgi:hypothetical protein
MEEKRGHDILKFSFVEDEERDIFEGILVNCGHEYYVIRLGELEVQ